MKKFKLKYKATFTGTIDVRADNRKEAIDMVERDFGGLQATVGHGITSNSRDEEGIVNWDIHIHPDTTSIK